MSDVGDVSWIRMIVAFTTVMGLLAAMGYILKYINARGLVLPGQPARVRRMKIVENLQIDTRRRLVIVNCDGREHLLLLSAGNDIVVETNLPSATLSPAP